MDEHAISFGPFRLLATQRLLLEGEKPVRLGSRAFDILTALVERSGEVVGKGELIARAWPQTFVEEANLKIQVSALRRALGDRAGGGSQSADRGNPDDRPRGRRGGDHVAPLTWAPRDGCWAWRYGQD